MSAPASIESEAERSKMQNSTNNFERLLGSSRPGDA